MTKTKICAISMFGTLLLIQCEAAVLVVDSFDEGAFSYSTDPGPRGDTQYLDVLGGTRYVSVSTDRRLSNVTAVLSGGSSAVGFDTGDGPTSIGGHQGSIFMRWSGMAMSTSSPVSLLGYDAFSISIPAIEGSGWVRVGVNKQSTGTSDTFLPISEPGEFIVPFSSADLGSGGFDSVRSIHLILTGATPDFGATISGFRVIPEPESVLLLSVSAWWICGRRKCKMLTSRGR